MDKDSLIKDIIYKRRNGENIVNDVEVINACKNEQSRDIIDNSRLGSYDKFGNYIIIPSIKNELISIPKLIYNVKSKDGSVIYELKANIPIFGDIYFKLTFGKNEAVLSLTETVSREANGYLEVYDEVLDAVAFGKGALPEDIILRNFHVIDDANDFGKRQEKSDFSNILTRKVYLSLLSKELKDLLKFDEHAAFENMVKTLKESGEYGKRVLQDFVDRLKERPGIFEINQTENYNKAVNEVLLSSLDIATTKEDKENYENKNTYLKVLNARNSNIGQALTEANKRVDEQYVHDVVEDAIEDYYMQNGKESETVEEFFDRIKDKKSVPTKRKLEKAILKQGKEQSKEEGKSKEDKIKAILNKKEEKSNKTPKGKKLKAAKGEKTASKKLKGKKKTKSSSKKKLPSKKKIAKKKAKKKLGKGKVKSKKKKLKKAQGGQKKAQTFKASKGGGGAKKKGKAKKGGGPSLNLLFVNKYYDKDFLQRNDVEQTILTTQNNDEQKNSVREKEPEPKENRYNEMKLSSSGVGMVSGFNKTNNITQIEKNDYQKLDVKNGSPLVSFNKEDLFIQREEILRAEGRTAGAEESNAEKLNTIINNNITINNEENINTFDASRFREMIQENIVRENIENVFPAETINSINNTPAETAGPGQVHGFTPAESSDILGTFNPTDLEE